MSFYESNVKFTEKSNESEINLLIGKVLIVFQMIRNLKVGDISVNYLGIKHYNSHQLHIYEYVNMKVGISAEIRATLDFSMVSIVGESGSILFANISNSNVPTKTTMSLNNIADLNVIYADLMILKLLIL
jgi:hypothetical protein